VVQAVSQRPLTRLTWVCARAIPCGACCGQIGTWIGFSAITFILPVSVIALVVLTESEVKVCLFMRVVYVLTGRLLDIQVLWNLTALRSFENVTVYQSKWHKIPANLNPQ
jgi:hypothetical protein